MDCMLDRKNGTRMQFFVYSQIISEVCTKIERWNIWRAAVTESNPTRDFPNRGPSQSVYSAWVGARKVCMNTLSEQVIPSNASLEVTENTVSDYSSNKKVAGTTKSMGDSQSPHGMSPLTRCSHQGHLKTKNYRSASWCSVYHV